MSQQFRIDSESLRDKINQLLPSQARGSINVDLTGQTTIVPIVDLTETAEGSALRQDLQTSYDVGTSFSQVSTATNSDLSLTPGFYRCSLTIFRGTSNMSSAFLGIRAKELSSGTYTNLIGHFTPNNTGIDYGPGSFTYDVNVFLRNGYDLNIINTSVTSSVSLSTRQIADITGNLVNPNGFV
jgi:hypothetical protein